MLQERIEQKISPYDVIEAMSCKEDAWSCVLHFAEEILHAKKYLNLVSVVRKEQTSSKP